MIVIFSCSTQRCLLRVIISVQVKVKKQQVRVVVSHFYCESETKDFMSPSRFFSWKTFDKLSARPLGVWVFDKDDNAFNLYMFASLLCDTWQMSLTWIFQLWLFQPLFIPCIPRVAQGGEGWHTHRRAAIHTHTHTSGQLTCTCLDCERKSQTHYIYIYFIFSNNCTSCCALSGLSQACAPR